jgi:hypothetical protein
MSYWERPVYYVTKDGRKFEYEKYLNVETKKHGKLPLPKDGYPYIIEYEDIKRPDYLVKYRPKNISLSDY